MSKKQTNAPCCMTSLYDKCLHGKSTETNDEREIEVLFDVQMTMTIIKMPQFKMYWSLLFRYERIATAKTLKRYETLRKFLYVTDNPENGNDKPFKVRPPLEMIRNSCIQIKPEHCHSIIEEIIPVKTKRSEGLKQWK